MPTTIRSSTFLLPIILTRFSLLLDRFKYYDQHLPLSCVFFTPAPALPASFSEKPTFCLCSKPWQRNLYAFCLSAHGLKGSDHPRLAVWNSQPQTTGRQGCNQRIQSSNSRLHAQLFRAFFFFLLWYLISPILQYPSCAWSYFFYQGKQSRHAGVFTRSPRQPSQPHIPPRTQTPALSCWGGSSSPDRHMID